MNWQPLLSIGLTYDEVLVIDPMPPFTREEYGEKCEKWRKIIFSGSSWDEKTGIAAIKTNILQKIFIFAIQISTDDYLQAYRKVILSK